MLSYTKTRDNTIVQKYPLPRVLLHGQTDVDEIEVALVWFWLIDEILSANLVYQSDYEIGSTTPSGEANEDHDMMMVMLW